MFKTWFTQQTQVSWTQVSKKWCIATYFVNSGMLLIISTKGGKWPICPWKKSWFKLMEQKMVEEDQK